MDRFREGEVFRISINISEPTSTIVDPYEQCKYKAQGTKAERLKPKRTTLYTEIKNEFGWDSLVNNPDTFSLDFAKKYFRGKEALNSLIDFISNEFQCNMIWLH